MAEPTKFGVKEEDQDPKKDKPKGYKRGSQRSRDFLDKVMKQLKRCVDADSHNRQAAIEDLKFLNGDQWDEKEKTRRARKGRPALQINLLPKFVDQVTGDARHNRPQIRIRPADGQASVDLAKIREGIIRNIEYMSNAPAIYDNGFEGAVSCGYGGWRVLTRYTEENPFQQEVYLEAIPNPFLVYFDPDAKDAVCADARYAFVLEKMPKSKFTDTWPKAEVPGSEIKWGKGVTNEQWYDKDTITVAEYFAIESREETFHLLEDGTVVTDDEYKEMIEEYESSLKDGLEHLMATIDQGRMAQAIASQAQTSMPQNPAQPPQPSAAPGGGPILNQPKAPAPQGQVPPGGMPPQGAPAPGGQPGQQPPQGQQLPQQVQDTRIPRTARPKIEQTRTANVSVVRQYLVTCLEVLEGPNDVPGKYIPLVPVYGKERNVEGKRYVRGLVRDAKDPQKMVNYWNTAAAEAVALQPKAPWLGTPKMFEGFEQDYALANVDNFPYLKFNIDPDAPQMYPQRQSAGQPPVAIFEQIRRGEENIKSVIGMFNADVGNFGSEQTGRAVTAKQKPGDIGTYAFISNLERSVAHTGRIINEMIPVIYDTERDVRLRHFDQSESFVPVNTTAGYALKSVKENPDRYVGMSVKKIEQAIRKYGKDAKFNEMTVGKYDVICTTGPSYSTARQESMDNMLMLAQAMPQQMAIGLDLLVKNMDFKEAEELAKRIRKTIPANLIELKEGEEPPQPPPPNPQMQMQMAKLQIEQGKAQLQQMKLQQEQMKLEHAKLKIQLEMAKSQGKQGQGKGPNPAEVAEKMERIKLDYQRLALDTKKLEHQINMDQQKHDHEINKTDMEHDLRWVEMELEEDGSYGRKSK